MEKDVSGSRQESTLSNTTERYAVEQGLKSVCRTTKRQAGIMLARAVSVGDSSGLEP